MTTRVLVAGVGNLFLRDDAFGSEAARRLGAYALPEGVTVVDYGIRGMHLAYDLLEGYDALVIVDAAPRNGKPGDIVVLEVGPDDLGTGELDAHGMEPTAVLASLGTLGGDLPRTFVVGCEPGDVSEGMGLTPPVEAAIERAVTVVLELLEHELHVSDRSTGNPSSFATPSATPSRPDHFARASSTGPTGSTVEASPTATANPATANPAAASPTTARERVS